MMQVQRDENGNAIGDHCAGCDTRNEDAFYLEFYPAPARRRAGVRLCAECANELRALLAKLSPHPARAETGQPNG